MSLRLLNPNLGRFVIRRQLHKSAPCTQFQSFKKLNESDSESLRSKFATLLGEKNVSLAQAVRSQFGQDEGPEKGHDPDVVVFAENTEQVAEIVKICDADNIPLIPHGTGTGLEAGVSALHGGVCLDMSAMDKITDYHPEDFDVVVQPGVTREGLNHFVKDDGLWFPVDPGANASICGMCATSASGTNAVRYGTTKENCLNLEVVLPNGEILYTGGKGKRPKKSSAGYNLTNLFVGSEGTLGVITSATMRLHAQPEATSAAVVSFPSIQAAVDTVVGSLQCSIPMARIELLDALSIKAGNSYSNLSLKEEPTLFLEFHSSEAGMDSMTSMVKDIAHDNGGSEFEWALQTEDRNKLWTARHKLWFASLNLKPGSRAVTTDVCVPISALPEMILSTREDIDKSGIVGPIFGHVGDGNFHAILLFDPEHDEEFKKCKEISYRMAGKALELGGTVTGEHGIGTGKTRLLEAQFGDPGIQTMKSIKKAIDPKGIMNPGKVLLF